MSGCRKDPDFKTCSKQSLWNLKCRHCGDLRHHSLMCASKPSSTYQAEPQHDSQRSGARGNSNRGRGGGRGGRGGRGRGGQRHNGDRRPPGNSNQSFQSQASNSTCPGQSSTTSQSASCANLEKHCNLKPLHNGNETQQNSKLGQVQPQKHVTWDITNANFMFQPDEEALRSQFNIPKEVKINTYYIGEFDSDIVNAFSSQKAPQKLKTHIQCVSRVELRLASNQTIQTSALLDTGSVLNFVSRSLIDRMGRPTPDGTWCGSIKTVSGVKTISTPFHNLQSRRIYWKPFCRVFLHTSRTWAPNIFTFPVEEFDRDFKTYFRFAVILKLAEISP